MRDAPNDAAAERLLVVGRLLAALPRSRGFRIGADGSISVYPASPRVRLPAAKDQGAHFSAGQAARSLPGRAGGEVVENGRQGCLWRGAIWFFWLLCFVYFLADRKRGGADQ